MNFALWIGFGAVFGIIAPVVSRVLRKNALSTFIMAVLGSISGGLLATLLFGEKISGFTIGPVITAVFASIIVLYLGQATLKR